MANCNTCGGVLSDPLSLANATGGSCSCNSPIAVSQVTATNNDCCGVTSVNGMTGDVTINFTEYTDADVYAAIHAIAPINFNPLTGYITHNIVGTAGTYGDSTHYPVFTVNATGHITGATLYSIPSATLGADLTAIEALTGTGYAVRTASNTWALRTLTSASASRITITNPAGTAGNSQFDLAVTGVSAGSYGSASTYPKFTVDLYGRITAASDQALPAVVIPPHSHYLGDLLNVSTLAGNITSSGVATASVGDSLNWNGSQWVPTTPVTTYSKSTLDLSPSTWKAAVCAQTTDDVEKTTTVNSIIRLRDSNDVEVVYINCVLYIPQASIPATSTDYIVANIPAGYEPIDNVMLPLAGAIDATPYKNDTNTTAFVGSLLLKISATAHCRPDGKMYFRYDPAGATFPTLGGTSTLIVNFIGCYISKKITITT